MGFRPSDLSLEITVFPLQKSSKTNNQLQCLTTCCPGPDQSLERPWLWKVTPGIADEISPKFPAFKNTCKTKGPEYSLFLGACPHLCSFPSIPPPSFLSDMHLLHLKGPEETCNQGEQWAAAPAHPGLTPCTCLHSPFPLTPQGAKAALPTLYVILILRFFNFIFILQY